MGTEYRSREITLQHWDYILSEFRFGVGCGCKLVFWQTEARYIWLNSGTRRDKRVRNAVPYLSQVAVGNKGRPDKCNRRSCTGNTERTYLHRAQLEIKKDILRTEPFQFLMEASLPSHLVSLLYLSGRELFLPTLKIRSTNLQELGGQTI